MPYFSAEQLADLRSGRANAHRQFASLRDLYLMRRYASGRAYEHATQGFGRRLGYLIRSVDLVFDALPPQLDHIPERDPVIDASIAIQSFVMNVFGCLDNLAWIWVFEKEIRRPDGRPLKPNSVGLYAHLLRNSFSDQFRSYLDSRQTWFGEMKGFRDSLAHRIPLYIPPFTISPDQRDAYNALERASAEAVHRGQFEEYDRLQAEQRELGRFCPWMTHSQFENAPAAVFHYQILADYNTIDEFGRKMLEELDR